VLLYVPAEKFDCTPSCIVFAVLTENVVFKLAGMTCPSDIFVPNTAIIITGRYVELPEG